MLYEVITRLYEVIYKVLEDVNSALIGMLEPEFEEVVTGDAEVREIFGIPRVITSYSIHYTKLYDQEPCR